MAYWNEYLLPGTLEDALAALDKAGGAGRVIAGGTDLLLDIQQGRHAPADLLVDITRIPDLGRIQIEGGAALIGAAVPHAAIIAHPDLQAQAAALVEACDLIGGPQVRRVATLGGNVAHALPAADGTIALLALDAQAEVASRQGRRWLPLSDLFAGPGQTTFDRSREILTAFRFELCAAGEASAFVRVMRPQGVAIAILNLACRLRLTPSGVVETARLAIGPAGPVPLFAARASAALIGRTSAQIDWAACEGALLEEASLRTSAHRATKDYRAHLSGVILRRAVETALARAGARQEVAA